VIGLWPHFGDHSKTDQEDAMMNGYGMGWGMGFGWLWMGVGLLVVVLTIAALIKYLRK
jgi:rhamnogalacturonyl hydrolase YesR